MPVLGAASATALGLSSAAGVAAACNAGLAKGFMIWLQHRAKWLSAAAGEKAGMPLALVGRQLTHWVRWQANPVEWGQTRLSRARHPTESCCMLEQVQCFKRRGGGDGWPVVVVGRGEGH